ncbi:MAG TPA: amidohydrolase family protein [Bryobacteraceae bacterium]|nr:amidohydrolase family protein [Bryobacteraceae bacterium]
MRSLLFILLFATAAAAQTPKLVDAHFHHNGDPGFLEKLVARLEKLDGIAFLLTRPEHLNQVRTFIASKPGRLIGFGDISPDDPNVLQHIDAFHAAGFRGLGEISRTRKPFDDASYTPIYDRAAKYRMMLLFHTGIVNRTRPDVPEDVSVDRLRVTLLDNIARRYPTITIIGAHLGNPDYEWAGEIARWNPNLYFDLSGSTLIKKQEDYAFFRTIFWWSSVASPHTPKAQASAFEKIIFGSDVFGGELEELDRSLERYQRMLSVCGVSKEAQANIFGGTLWRILTSMRR